MKRRAGKRVDLYKLIKEYNLLKGNANHPNVQNIIESYDLGLIEEEIRRVQEFIEDIKHNIDERERSVVRERQKDRKRELRLQREFEMDEMEDRLMGRRNRRASDVIQSLESRIARLEKRSSVKTARSIPRPPRNTITELIDTKRATKISDMALDKKYGYGLSKPNTFGYEANKYSSLYALGVIADNMSLVRRNPEDKKLIEMVADAVHDGWSYAAYNVDDPRYETQPEKRENRIALADAPYRSLSEGEKEKDRVIARALIDTVYMADKR